MLFMHFWQSPQWSKLQVALAAARLASQLKSVDFGEKGAEYAILARINLLFLRQPGAEVHKCS